MKTLIPIKELISFRMDENKIWWLDYDWSGYLSYNFFLKRTNRSFEEDWVTRVPQMLTLEEISLIRCDKEFDYEISKFVEEDNDFVITPESYYVNSRHRLLFPKTQTGCVFTINWDFNRNPLPYYGNPHYKKYIEDNNGECPLPFPKDMK